MIGRRRPLARWLLPAIGCALPLLAWGGPPLVLQDPATGARVTVESGDRLLHVVLFATWCPHCVDEFDRLSDLEARWKPRGYRLVLVAVSNRHTAAKLTEFRKRRDPPGELLFDAEGSVERTLRATGLPAHLLFDASGDEFFRAGNLSRDLERAVAARLTEAARPGRGDR